MRILELHRKYLAHTKQKLFVQIVFSHPKLEVHTESGTYRKSSRDNKRNTFLFYYSRQRTATESAEQVVEDEVRGSGGATGLRAVRAPLGPVAAPRAALVLG